VLRRPTLRQFGPLRLSGFRLLFGSTLASSLGTLLAQIALAIDVKDRTNSGIWVGAVLVVGFLPTILVGLTLGPLIDRLERRKLMVVADLVRAVVFFGLVFVGSAGGIVALAFVAGLATGFFRPAVYAGIPNLVPEEELADANALLQTVENASWAIGPILGGLLTRRRARTPRTGSTRSRSSSPLR
jgi:MFS transporter, DHA3 family, macrolide efflux protein